MASNSQSFSTKNDTSLRAPLSSSTQSKPTMAELKQYVDGVINPKQRENALSVLSKRRDMFHELAPLLWNTACIATIFLQEMISVYPAVTSLKLTSAQSVRVCNVLALLQCLASHPETRMPFLNANMPQYFYPFLQTKSKLAQFEYLRLASLGVIGALVKTNSKEVISFILSSEVVPLCLQCMEIGKDLSKTVATFILQRILADDEGIEYICETAERFFAVARVLEIVLGSLDRENPSSTQRLLKIIISCYSQLSHNRRAGRALASCLPKTLMDGTFANYIREEPATLKLLETMHENIKRSCEIEQGGGGFKDKGGSST